MTKTRTRLLLGAMLAGIAVVLFLHAPRAHADANSTYANCLAHYGVSGAISLDQVEALFNGRSATHVMAYLREQGQSPQLALIEVTCDRMATG